MEQPDEQTGARSKYTCVPSLSSFQWTQILLLASCYAMAFSSVTLVMSKAPLIVKSTGGKGSLGPVSIALYEIGKSLVILPVGPAVRRFGRKRVFMAGGLFGLLSSTVGMLGIEFSVSYLILLSTFMAGIAAGIAYGYRFAAIEVIPDHREFAVTFCLTGGVLGAVVGPVSATYSKDLFAKDYLGVYMINFIFVAIMVFLTAFLRLDQHVEQQALDNLCQTSRTNSKRSDSCPWTIKKLFRNKTFFYGCLASTMSWVCMSLPMSVVGLAMEDESISDQAILLAFIMHFMGMFLPGFGTCRLIESFGFTCVNLLSVSSFVLATTLNLLVQDDKASLWIIGQFFVGLGWNLGFSTATVMVSTICPPEDRKSATVVQAYNDFFTFFINGLITISSGYIYAARGGGVDGWRLLNFILLVFIGIQLVVVLAAWRVIGRHLIDDHNEGDIELGARAQLTVSDSVRLFRERSQGINL